MLQIYCCDPLNPSQVEGDFAEEFELSRASGFETALLDFDLLNDLEDVVGTLRRLPVGTTMTTAIYRGWMLSPERYRVLFNALRTKNIRLINTPDQYRAVHSLPESYDIIKCKTPKSVWLRPNDSRDIDQVLEVLQVFDGGPVIVKDYVKSCKHNWYDACFIPDSASSAEVSRVVAGFLERQGEGLNGNLVFREFLQLESLGTHPLSHMPLTLEYRLFIYRGEITGCFPYWSDVDYDNTQPPVEEFQPIIQKINSSFFTMDIARTTDRQWVIIELGDGQVSGFPNPEAMRCFYGWLHKHGVR